MTDTHPPHTPEFWAAKPRDLRPFTVKRATDTGDSVDLYSEESGGFTRSKTDLPDPIEIGATYHLETVNWSHITGFQSPSGEWLFRMTDDDLAKQARDFSADVQRRAVENLERNKKVWAATEAALPGWLRARIQRFRDAAGEKFLLDGWGYELAICQLADAYQRGDDAAVNELDEQLGCSGNQHDCAKCLAKMYNEGHADRVALVPAGLSPITGSADYT